MEKVIYYPRKSYFENTFPVYLKEIRDNKAILVNEDEDIVCEVDEDEWDYIFVYSDKLMSQINDMVDRYDMLKGELIDILEDAEFAIDE